MATRVTQSGGMLANEEAVDDREPARRRNHYEPEIVSRRVSLNGCGPYLTGVVRKLGRRYMERGSHVHSRRGGARNLAQGILCSARHHSQSRLLAEETLKYKLFFFFLSKSQGRQRHGQMAYCS